VLAALRRGPVRHVTADAAGRSQRADGGGVMGEAELTPERRLVVVVETELLDNGRD